MNLPKKDKDGNQYLSYSQINSFLNNRRDYIRQYFLNEKFEGNAYTSFGKRIGEALENNDFSGFTETEQVLLNSIPRHDQFERKVVLNRKGFYVVGYIDTNTSEDGKIEKLIDYKTGDMTKEAVYLSEDYSQLYIYAGALEQELGVLPKKASVVLIERLGNPFKGEKLMLGSRYITIDKKITKTKIKEVVKKVDETAKEISEYYEVFLKLNKNYSRYAHRNIKRI